MAAMKRAKQEYDQITIPKELSERVLKEINQAEEKRKGTVKTMKKNVMKKWAAAVAVAAGAFIIGLNTNQSFAQGMSNVPVLGELAKVLTFRAYEETTEEYEIKVEIPTIEMISEDFKDLEEKVNAEILEVCEGYAKAARADAEAYREAFLATGGTVEEWEAHNIRITVWYEVKLQTEKYLSLAIKKTESWNSAGSETKIFNIDLETGGEVDFETAMGETWYEDNYAVDTETAAIYAVRIQEAVEAKDMEKLADLTAFPVYVGLGDGIVAETREDFLALEKEQIFAEEFTEAILNADLSELEPSRAGFVLSGSEGKPNVIFGVQDGLLKISGINY